MNNCETICPHEIPCVLKKFDDRLKLEIIKGFSVDISECISYIKIMLFDENSDGTSYAERICSAPEPIKEIHKIIDEVVDHCIDIRVSEYAIRRKLKYVLNISRGNGRLDWR